MSFWKRIRQWFSAEPDDKNDVNVIEHQPTQGQLTEDDIDWDDLWDEEREEAKREIATFSNESEEQDIDYPNLEL